MKKIRLLTLMMAIALTQLSAAPATTTDDSDIDQLIKSVKEKLEKRRQERAQLEQEDSQDTEEEEESEFEEIIVPENTKPNQNGSSSRVTPDQTKGQSVSAGPRLGRKRAHARAQSQSVSEYPEASFPKDATISFQPARKRNKQAVVAESEASFPKSYAPSFQPSSKRLKRD